MIELGYINTDALCLLYSIYFIKAYEKHNIFYVAFGFKWPDENAQYIIHQVEHHPWDPLYFLANCVLIEYVSSIVPVNDKKKISYI